MATNSSLNSAQTLPDSSQDDAVEIDLFQLIRAIFKRIKLCIGICGAAIICGLLYCFMATPTYLANCRMLVEQSKLRVTQVQDVYSQPSSPAKDFILTQIKLITSDNILSSVCNDIDGFLYYNLFTFYLMEHYQAYTIIKSNLDFPNTLSREFNF